MMMNIMIKYPKRKPNPILISLIPFKLASPEYLLNFNDDSTFAFSILEMSKLLVLKLS